MHSKNELTKSVAFRYFIATKKEKGIILNEFCLNTGFDRKYAIKKLRKAFLYPNTAKQKIKKKNMSKYMIIKAIIKKLWEVGDYPSGTRLHSILPTLVELGIKYREIYPTQNQTLKLLQISSPSIDRLLKSESRLRFRRINLKCLY